MLKTPTVRVTALETALSGPEAQLPEIKRRITQVQTELNSRIAELAKDQKTTQKTVENVQAQVSAQRLQRWLFPNGSPDATGRIVATSG
jgi:vacuolar-type H+-ATPase subunit I/STV1